MRDLRFTFVCSVEERRMLERLAVRQQRTRSDSIRWLIREAYDAHPADEVALQSDVESEAEEN